MAAFSKHQTSDLIDLLGLCLEKGQVKSPIGPARALLGEAEASVDGYFSQLRDTYQHGPARQALLKLWKMANAGSSQPDLLEGLASLPLGALRYLEQRANRLWGALGLGQMPNGSLLTWAEGATAENLATAITRCCAEGAVNAEGRKRAGAKRSRNRYEPVILGIADRTTGNRPKIGNPTQVSPTTGKRRKRLRSKSAGDPGRSRIDDKVHLICMLANDWYRITGQFPTPGRSEERVFGEFIISVFEWAGIAGVDYALRVYWFEMKTRKQRSQNEKAA
jgi:hypothetical protein